MSKIFISYRRNDSADVTGRIGDRLRQHFGDENIFTDVDDIPLGVDFRAYVDAAVGQCDVLLAVIGRDWLTSKNEDGELRLSEPADFVRIEIESALQRDIPVIPLLVRGVKMPRPSELPESIESLAFRNAQKIRSDPDFNNDVSRLIRSLDQHLELDKVEIPAVENVLSQGVDESAALSAGRTDSISVNRVEQQRPQRSDDYYQASKDINESEHLATLRKELLTATSDYDYKNVKFKLEKYLSDYPNTVDAKFLLEKADNALRSLASEDWVANLGSAPPSARAKSGLPIFHWLRGNSLLIGTAGAIVVAVGIYPLVSQILIQSDKSIDDPVNVTEQTSSAIEPDTDSVPSDYILPDMVRIPEGTFMMGSDSGSNDERPLHSVSIPAFELARNELTWAEWQLCEDDAGCNTIQRPAFLEEIPISERSNHPVVNVDIDSVKEYINWINTKTGLRYRLPSEAEWEYAARAGSRSAYSWGDAIGENRANCNGCGSEWGGQSTAPTGSFSQNPFGLNDMHGNVWEWVADCWHESYQGAPDDGSAWVEDCVKTMVRCAAGPGAVYHCICVLRTASGSATAMLSAVLASAWPEPYLDLFPFIARRCGRFFTSNIGLF